MKIVSKATCPDCKTGPVVESSDIYGDILRCIPCGWLADKPQGWSTQRVLHEAWLMRQTHGQQDAADAESASLAA